jgi:anti-sigma regulatory factor (Ser/Thr protein kinase)
MANGGHVVHERLAVAPTSIRDARALVGRFSSEQGASPEQTVNIQLAISELVANVVRHAHPLGGDHEFEIEARLEDDELVFCVRDFGVGSSRPSPTPGLGVGLTVAGKLARTITVSDAGPGTLIVIRFPRAA